MSKVIDIIAQLRGLNGALPKREQHVADYVLANLETIAYQRQSEIAIDVGWADELTTRVTRIRKNGKRFG